MSAEPVQTVTVELRVSDSCSVTAVRRAAAGSAYQQGHWAAAFLIGFEDTMYPQQEVESDDTA